jgi:hypothetical protein
MEPINVSSFGGVTIPPSRAHFINEDLKSVVSYGTKIASTCHQYALTVDKIPVQFEGVTNILDASIATLSQVSSLFKDESSGQRYKSTDHPLNDEGLSYVAGLVLESARALTMFESVIADTCLPIKEYRAKVKQDAKALKKNGKEEIKISTLKLDEKVFMEHLELMKWKLAKDITKCVGRLYDIQLCLLLVFQVVTVGALSKDL